MPNLEINIKTSADTAGVEKAATGMEKLLTASEREVAEVNRLVKNSQRLTAERRNSAAAQDAINANTIRDLTNLTDKARVSEIAFYNLDARIQKTADANEKFGTKAGHAASSAGKMGMLANQAGYQVQDFAVQVGAGTSAMTAFSQQAPQLIGAFAAAGVISGPLSMAMIAVGVAIPIIIGGIKAMGIGAGEAKEDTDKLAESLQKVGEHASSSKLDRLDQMAVSLEDSAKAAIALTQEFPKTKKAQEEFAVAALSNADKLLEAQRNIAKAMGLQVDAIKQLEEASARAEQKRTLVASQAIKDQQDELVKAQRLQAQAEAEVMRKQEDLARHQNEIERTRNALNIDSAKLKQLESAQLGSAPGSMFEGMSDRIHRQAVDAANKKSSVEELAADPGLKDRVSQAEKEINTLSDDIRTLQTSLGKSVTDAGVAANQVVDLAGAVGENIEKIQTTLTSENLVAKSKLLVDTGEQFAKDIGGVSDKIVSTNEKVKTAQATIADAVKDGAITANEHGAVAAAMVTLVGQLQLGTAKLNDVNTSITDVIKLQNRFAEVAGGNTKAINNTNQRVSALENQVKQLLESGLHQ